MVTVELPDDVMHLATDEAARAGLTVADWISIGVYGQAVTARAMDAVEADLSSAAAGFPG